MPSQEKQNNGNAYGKDKEHGKSGQQTPAGTNPGNGNGNGAGQKGKGTTPTGPVQKPEIPLREETTFYLYNGTDVLKEYTEEGSPLRSYHYGAGEVISEKMFGFHGRKDEGREGNLRTRGGLLYNGYDAIGNVTDLSDHLGNEVIQYRYDAFGGLYTGITAPYNTQGYTGQTYDPKSGLLDYNARWYSAKAGRFMSKDSFQGYIGQPQTHNLYSYVSNNPVFCFLRGKLKNMGISNKSAQTATSLLLGMWQFICFPMVEYRLIKHAFSRQQKSSRTRQCH